MDVKRRVLAVAHTKINKKLTRRSSPQTLDASGGVGPTPDDVTMAGVAAAFNVPLARDQALETRLRAYFGEHLTAAHLKLADVPEGELS